MAVELPYSQLTDNSTISYATNDGRLVSTDAVIEMAVAMVNARSDILAEYEVQIVRVK
jgi:hypothetical protein